VRGKTGWREVEIGRGSSELTCPVVALETWLRLGRIAQPLPPSRQGLGKSQLQRSRLLETRLHPPHAAKALQSLMKF
jgi:hypothetical protein